MWRSIRSPDSPMRATIKWLLCLRIRAVASGHHHAVAQGPSRSDQGMGAGINDTTTNSSPIKQVIVSSFTLASLGSGQLDHLAFSDEWMEDHFGMTGRLSATIATSDFEDGAFDIERPPAT